jgi:dipeptidyl aminopeptidase/acylaminoacyl peptidase
VGLTLYDVFRDGRVLVSQNETRQSTSGLGTGQERERDLSWLEATAAADLSPDGRTLLFTEQCEALAGFNVVGMRGTDGSPVINLGEGYAGGLSPDGRWAVAIRLAPKPHLSLLPTGAGQARDLDPGPITDFEWSCWSPDGRRVVFGGLETGHAVRAYVQDVAGGPPRLVTPDGAAGGWHLVSPDGRSVLAARRDSTFIFPLDGGPPRHVAPLRPDDMALGWLPDGRSLLVRARATSLPAHIERVDLTNGRRQFVRDLMPPDAAGVTGIAQVLFTHDLRAHAYSYLRNLSNLYVVQGLR